MKILTAFVAIMFVGGSLFAAKFDVMKKNELESLTKKQEIIEKRIQCIKKATTSKAFRECKKKYSLVKRKKHAKKKTKK